MADVATKSLTRRLAKIGIVVGIGAIVVAAVLLLTLNALKISFFSISGSSMEPELSNRDSLVLKQAVELEKGNLVFFYLPKAWTYEKALKNFGDQDTIVVKRVVAVQGDTVAYDGQSFLVNGEIVYSFSEEGYTCADGPEDYSRELKEGELLAFGDNAQYSLDSRRVFCDGRKDFIVSESVVVDHGTVAFKF